MKIGIVSCGALALLFLVSSPACGGDSSAAPKSPAPAVSATDAADTPATPAPVEQEPAVAKKPTRAVRVDFELAKRLFGTDPTVAAVDNPSTPEKVALGRVLFHEPHLSNDGTRSCASCHDLANYGQDGKRVSSGNDAKHGGRNTPTVWNAARQFVQFWDGRAPTVEEQALIQVMQPFEHGLASEIELVKKIQEKPELAAGFARAFPDDADAVSVKNFKLAIGAFERTLVTKSKFDAWLDGDQKALDNDQKLGLKLFMEIGCITCHTTRLVGGHMFQKTGLLKPYPTEDTGRAKLTGSDADKYFFKVPTLLNVEKTGPYFHDGKVATLEEAVNVMADIQLNKQLKPEETAALVAFLKALTGPLPQAK